MRRRRRIIEVALALLCAALTAWLFIPAKSPKIPSAPRRAMPVAPAPSADVLANVPPIDHYAAVENRLIFDPARKAPPPSVKKEDPGSAPPPPSALLTGVILKGDRKLAILRAPGWSTSKNLSLGDKLDAWTLDAIAPDHVSLKSGPFSQEIRIQPPTGGFSSSSNTFQTPNMIAQP